MKNNSKKQIRIERHTLRQLRVDDVAIQGGLANSWREMLTISTMGGKE